MALNWAMLTEDGARPVPLPQEKIFYSVENCSLQLEFKNHKLKWEAKGTSFVTNKRIVFVRQPPLPAPADPSQPSQHLRTLSVPLSRFLDTRYLIPIFSAAFYEARIMAVPEGGLPNDTLGGQLKLLFNEGGGSQFSEAVEEVKRRLEEGSVGEALPLYEPPPEGSRMAASQAAPGAAATTTTSPQALQNEPTTLSPVAAPSSRLGAPPSPSTAYEPQPGRARRMDSLPAPEELEAASVALAQEERERAQEIARAAGDNVLHPHGESAGSQGNNGGAGPDPVSEEPPAYEA